MSEEPTKLKIPTPFGPMEMGGKKTAEIITILSLVVMVGMGFVLWEHKAEASEGQKETQKILKESNRKLTKAIEQQTKAQKFQTCILSLPLEKREAEYANPNSLCRRLTQ